VGGKLSLAGGLQDKELHEQLLYSLKGSISYWNESETGCEPQITKADRVQIQAIDAAVGLEVVASHAHFCCRGKS